RAGSLRRIALGRLGEGAERRRARLARLEPAAPIWASAIAGRRPGHAGPQAPGDAVAAWTWLRLRDELDRRTRVSLPELQARIDKLAVELSRATHEVTERRDWSADGRRKASQRPA